LQIGLLGTARAARAGTGARAAWTAMISRFERENDVREMALKFVLKKENVPEHSCHFSSRVPENWTATICAKTNIWVAVVDCNPQGCTYLVFHKLLFIFKGVFAVGCV
jgi:hypothetical protein